MLFGKLRNFQQTFVKDLVESNLKRKFGKNLVYMVLMSNLLFYIFLNFKFVHIEICTYLKKKMIEVLLFILVNKFTYLLGISNIFYHEAKI